MKKDKSGFCERSLSLKSLKGRETNKEDFDSVSKSSSDSGSPKSLLSKETELLNEAGIVKRFLSLNEGSKLRNKKPIENFTVEETLGGIQIQIKQPHLLSVRVNSNQDGTYQVSNSQTSTIKKTSIKIYPLKLGRTTIGSALHNDIVLSGVGIEAEHCFIENCLVFLDETQNQSDDNFDDDEELNLTSTTSCSHSSSISCKISRTRAHMCTIFPIGTLCAVDDVLIDAPFILNSGNFHFSFTNIEFSFVFSLFKNLFDV
jgi:hypothetical protein